MSKCQGARDLTIKVSGNADSSRLVIFEPGSIWRPFFLLDKSSACFGRRAPDQPPKQAKTGGCGLCWMWRRRRSRPREAAAATRRHTQRDPRHLVLMNTSSCHRAPHVSEPTPLCLFIHYLLCSSNKAAPARDTRRAEASAEDLNGCTVSGNKSGSVEG